jgi:hypothetical protein
MKPEKVAELAAVEVVCNGVQVLVWTVFDEEDEPDHAGVQRWA